MAVPSDFYRFSSTTLTKKHCTNNEKMAATETVRQRQPSTQYPPFYSESILCNEKCQITVGTWRVWYIYQLARLSWVVLVQIQHAAHKKFDFYSVVRCTSTWELIWPRFFPRVKDIGKYSLPRTDELSLVIWSTWIQIVLEISSVTHFSKRLIRRIEHTLDAQFVCDRCRGDKGSKVT